MMPSTRPAMVRVPSRDALEQPAGDAVENRADPLVAGPAGPGEVPRPFDRRRNVITITPAGRRQLGRLDELLAEIQDELLASLSASHRQQLIQPLSRVLDG